MTVIMPTHTCFDDAVEILANILRVHPDAKDTREFLVVHAICWRPELGDFSHAWIENEYGNRVAFFMGIINGKRILLAESVEVHYRKLSVKEFKKYSPLEALAAEIASGHYGPWEERFIKLCNNKREREKLNDETLESTTRSNGIPSEPRTPNEAEGKAV